MARARNIKPGFFRNADLVELSFEARLLFIGLWTIADREGRLEDRPKQIKMELFPADNMDCEALLSQLEAINMIERYSHDGARVIQVVNFAKHQNPHRDEKVSTLPDRDGNIAATKEARCKHGANTVLSDVEQAASTVAIGLNPESLILNPDPGTLKPEVKAKPARAPRKPAPTHMPDDFTVSDGVKAWADGKGYGDLNAHLEAFRDKAKAKGYTYISWDDAFKTAIREDWGKVRVMGGQARASPGMPANRQEAIEARNAAVGDEWLRQQGITA